MPLPGDCGFSTDAQHAERPARLELAAELDRKMHAA